MYTAIETIGQGILETFAGDHERLRGLLGRAIEACSSCATREARSAFYSFTDGLCRHIQAEDELLFPAFEAHTGLRGGCAASSMAGSGPTARMRREHRQIERRLNQIGDALDGKPDLRAVARELVELRSFLEDHDRREECVLYPACDRLFTQPERSATWRALRAREPMRLRCCAACNGPQVVDASREEVVFCDECLEMARTTDEDELGGGD